MGLGGFSVSPTRSERFLGSQWCREGLGGCRSQPGHGKRGCWESPWMLGANPESHPSIPTLPGIVHPSRWILPGLGRGAGRHLGGVSLHHRGVFPSHLGCASTPRAPTLPSPPIPGGIRLCGIGMGAFRGAGGSRGGARELALPVCGHSPPSPKSPLSCKAPQPRFELKRIKMLSPADP